METRFIWLIIYSRMLGKSLKLSALAFWVLQSQHHSMWLSRNFSMLIHSSFVYYSFTEIALEKLGIKRSIGM